MPAPRPIIHDPKTCKLGRGPTKHDPRTLRLTRYVAALPAPKPSVDYSSITPDWGMMLNDAEGDCTIAGWGHLRLLHASLAKKPWRLTDPQIQGLYVAITGLEGAPYDPATGANDNGCVELDVLNYIRKAGKITAYVAIDARNTDQVKFAVDVFGGVYMGVGLPLSAQSQTVWDVEDPTLAGDSAPYSWGGHCMIVVGYDADGVTFITWGGPKRATWRWWTTYVSPAQGGESYALLTPDLLGADGRTWEGVDLTTLKSDIAQFTAPSATHDEADMPAPPAAEPPPPPPNPVPEPVAVTAPLEEVKEGVVEEPGEQLRTDGPTFQEYVAAGYAPDTYPPQGYASKHTEEELVALMAELAADRGGATVGEEQVAEEEESDADGRAGAETSEREEGENDERERQPNEPAVDPSTEPEH